VRAPFLAVNVEPSQMLTSALDRTTGSCFAANRSWPLRYRLIRVESTEALTLPFDAVRMLLFFTGKKENASLVPLCLG